MRIIAVPALCLASLLANPYFIPEADVGVLSVWPTARSTALAGAMTGLADEADATFFNPAGLAFQSTAKAELTDGNWLPGLYPGLCYLDAAGGAPLRFPFLRGRKAYLAGSLTYMTVGETDIVNDRGDFLGRVNNWRGVAAACAAVALTDNIGAGVSVKLVRSEYPVNDWVWLFTTDDGLETGESQTAVAADIGLLCHPSSAVSVGLAVANLGPSVQNWPDYGYLYGGAFPRVAGLGLCWTAVDTRIIRLHVMPEMDKSLYRVFYDSTGTKTLGRKLEEQWRDVWKGVGIEATAFDLVSLRLGYLEDLTNQRGGIIYQEDGWYSPRHYGIWDVLTRKGLGQFRKVGLCWGFGVAYKGYLRFDVSSDAAIYDFPTSNWKLQLTCNDIGRLF